MSASAERRGAVRALLEVERGGYAGRLLAAAAQPGVRARTLGVLRWQRLLDAVLAPLSRFPLARLDPEVRAALRLGLFELSRLGVPAPVATDGAVRLVRSLGKASAAGLVNAVLRRAATSWRQVEAAAPLDLALAHPEWLYRRWCRAFGADAAEAVLRVDQEPAAPWVWLADDGARAAVAAAGVALTPHPWCPGAVTAADAGALLRAAAAPGVVIQDPSSQLVALVAAALLPRGGRAVDLCAAPGGKTALLAARGGPALLVAADLRPSRARVVRTVAAAVGVVAADAATPPFPARSWDLVLLDAPCSGTGTLRRRPELRWRLDEAAIVDRARLQTRLLAAAVELVRPGGVLLYSTCSLEAEENEGVLAAVDHGLATVPLAPLVPAGAPAQVTAVGGIRILPHDVGDGFTLHALRRPE